MAPRQKAASTKSGIKKPISGYMFFCMENRPVILAENPGIKFPDVGKKMGARWNELSESEKAPYLKKAEEDKKRYQAETAASGGGEKPKKEDKKAAAAAADDDDEKDDDE